MAPRVIPEDADLAGSSNTARPQRYSAADEEKGRAHMLFAKNAHEPQGVGARPVVEGERHVPPPDAAAVDGLREIRQALLRRERLEWWKSQRACDHQAHQRHGL